MTWVRLDEDFADHPKVAIVGPLASWLHVKALSYCNRYLTDGRVPIEVALSLVSWSDVEPLKDPYLEDALTSEAINKALVERLTNVGLWDDTSEKGYYTIHDYLEYQPSRAQVQAARGNDRKRKLSSDRIPAGIQTESERNPNGIQPDSKRSVSVSVSVSDPPTKPTKTNKETPTKPKAKQEPQPSPDALAVLEALNESRKRAVIGARAYRPLGDTLRHIQERLDDGYTVDDCRHAIEVYEANTKAKPDTAKWFNAVTPFRKDNFLRALGGSPAHASANGNARYFGNHGDGDQTHLLGNYKIPDFAAQERELSIRDNEAISGDGAGGHGVYQGYAQVVATGTSRL